MRSDLKTGYARKASTALLASAVICSAGLAQADDAFALQTLEKMSDYLAAQTAISFDYDTSLDVVTSDEQKLTIASSGTVGVQRPNMLHAVKKGGFATVEVGFDGQTLTVLNAETGQYGQEDLAGSVEDLIETLRETYKRPLPAADLLAPDYAALLTEKITNVKDLGSGVIGGAICDHFAFRTDEFDLQLWIAEGSDPYPCQYAITNRKVAGWPEYRVVVRNWQTGDGVADAAKITLPEAAEMVAIPEIPDLDDLAGIYKLDGGQ